MVTAAGVPEPKDLAAVPAEQPTSTPSMLAPSRPTVAQRTLEPQIVAFVLRWPVLALVSRDPLLYNGVSARRTGAGAANARVTAVVFGVAPGLTGLIPGVAALLLTALDG